MLKSPTQQIGKSMKMPAFFLAFNVSVFSILCLVLFPLWPDVQQILILLILGCLSLLLWGIILVKDPGVLKKHHQSDFLVSSILNNYCGRRR